MGHSILNICQTFRTRMSFLELCWVLSYEFLLLFRFIRLFFGKCCLVSKNCGKYPGRVSSSDSPVIHPAIPNYLD